MRTFKITIPKIEIAVQIEEIDNNKKPKKEKVSDYYFVTLHNNIKHKKITILTIQDCLTVPIFSLSKIDCCNLTTDTICGFNDILPLSKTVFFSRDFKNIRHHFLMARAKILNDLCRYSKELFTNSIIDIVSLNKKEIMWSYNLAVGREVVCD